MKKVNDNDNRPTLEKLNEFVNARPGLDFANYGDSKSYNAESREITRDRGNYLELVSFASWRVRDLEGKLTARLFNSPDRLTMNDEGRIIYHAGQYHPTEYRPAAARAIASLIWADYSNERNEKGEPVYKDGHEIRAAIRRNVSRRVAKFYFN